MTGRRHTMDSKGASYEDCAQLLIGRIASLIPVPHEKDFGIDYFGQPRVPVGAQTETVKDLFALQVKGGDELLRYGGLSTTGEWRQYEITWLKSLVTPLYLAKVDASLKRVDIYSLGAVLMVLWPSPLDPFAIQFTLRSEGKAKWEKPTSAPNKKGTGHGDGNVWIVDLGPPILSLTADNLNDAEFRTKANEILTQWIQNDHENLMRYQQFVPLVKRFESWATNQPQPNPITVREWQFYGEKPGVNISRLCQSAEPILVNLGIHLKNQNNDAVERLIPILQWLNEQGQLGVSDNLCWTRL
jgi:hypothetical protein